MAEHRVWAIIGKRDGHVHGVNLDKPCGDSLVTRCVEATLTIPDEPEWTVLFYQEGHVFIVKSGTPKEGAVTVRAPDASTALARALANRQGG